MKHLGSQEMSNPNVASQLLAFRMCLTLALRVSDETIHNSPREDHLVAQALPKVWGSVGKEGVVPVRTGNSLPQRKSIGFKTHTP